VSGIMDEPYLRAINERYRIFNQMIDRKMLEADDSASFTFSAKDNLCTKEFQARAGSRILEGYRPPFDSTPVRKLREAGGLLLGKTNMDEFGFGTFSTNSGFEIPLNPFDTGRACGGSSGGAAAAAALIDGHVALGVSTGGSISAPASFCGVYGLTPTYGRVSRYGLIDYGNSLDKVGLLSRSMADIKRLLPVISGSDPKDPTSCTQPRLEIYKKKIKRLALPKEAMANISPEVGSVFHHALERMELEHGISIEEVSMPSLRFAMPAYYILATTEASTNLARYCGMRFGVPEKDVSQHFNDFFSGVRSECFGEEAKRRILLGTFCRMVGFRDKYYLKSLAVRQLITREYQKVLGDHDLIVTPTMPFVAPRFDEIAKMKPLDMYSADFLTIPPNLTGLPHLSVPCGYVSSMPVGMQFVAPHWDESGLISMGEEWGSQFHLVTPEVVQ
jgi:aspartyl-tRNA(Asn)/glutamyl-tRNA(Gln) amidotransferase subunit A